MHYGAAACLSPSFANAQLQSVVGMEMVEQIATTLFDHHHL
jgi:hypothetical protein